MFTRYPWEIRDPPMRSVIEATAVLRLGATAVVRLGAPHGDPSLPRHTQDADGHDITLLSGSGS